MIIRTRFAPSPTGFLHLGSARTALFCYLYARKKGGEFVLRIEDTDQERSTQEATKAILDSLAWLQLHYDEGPYYQTQRLDHYRNIAKKMLDSGQAYRCYCSKERLNELREKQLANKEKPRYDGHCRDKHLPDTGEPHVIRFKNPPEGSVTFNDLVCGEITISNSEMDDLILIRGDGFPTYNFCVVIDDMDMRITHVIRGADHINNTPRQINLFNALDAKPPIYAHVPLILGTDGKLLSKRHGAINVMYYHDEGFLPEAMINYLVRLGWSHGDQEIFSRAELINLFDIKDVNKAAAAFSPEKLLWLNRHYLKTLDPALLAERLNWYFADLKIDTENGPELVEIVKMQRDRCETLREMAVKSRIFYEDFADYEEKSKHFLVKETLPFLEAAKHRFAVINDWTREILHMSLQDIAKQFELKLGNIAQPIRVAVSGSTVSPALDITLQLLGRKKVGERMDRAIKFIEGL